MIVITSLLHHYYSHSDAALWMNLNRGPEGCTEVRCIRDNWGYTVILFIMATHLDPSCITIIIYYGKKPVRKGHSSIVAIKTSFPNGGLYRSRPEGVPLLQ